MNNIQMDILPIDKDVLDKIEKEVEEEEEIKVTEVSTEIENNDDASIEELSEPHQEEIFVKPKKTPKLNKNGKPRKPLSDKQKENLRMAREKSVARRKAVKEATQLEKAERKLKRDLVAEEKAIKQEEQDRKIRMAAQLKLDAEKAAHFSEARLTALMEQTLDNYIAKKKAQKPKPRETIPYPVPQQPLPPPKVQQNNNYYSQSNHRVPRQPHYQLPKPRNNNPMDTLFGNFGE
jgi:hypothetical protein